MTITTENKTEINRTSRLQSLDTLRGADMLFIMGGGSLFSSLGHLFPNTLLETWGQQMNHVEWNGFAFYDLIFPLFLFIAGISLPYSVENSFSRGISKQNISKKIFKRGATLIFLGIVYNGLLTFDFENLRIASVLGRIGLAWMVAALLYIWSSKRIRLVFTLSVLFGYWGILAFCTAPDNPEASPFSMEGSIVGYIDRMLLPGKPYLGIHDPEGILSTLPAIVTALLGMFCGQFVKSSQTNGHMKTLIMLGIGISLWCIGWGWDMILPVNKNLWTSSFVCVAGGLSIVLFAIFYWIIDVMKYRKWTFFFRVIGMNSITIYMAQQFLDFYKPVKTIFGGVLGFVPEQWYAIGYWSAYIMVCWGFLYFLYKKKIFLKV